MTPEQIAEAIAWARMAVADMGNRPFPIIELERALLAEHERAERLERQIDTLAALLLHKYGGPVQDESACEMAGRLLLAAGENARDAARWRAVREMWFGANRALAALEQEAKP